MVAFPPADLTNLDLTPLARHAREAGDAVASAALEITKDATYTAVGLGILAYQRLQVRRREFEKTLQR